MTRSELALQLRIQLLSLLAPTETCALCKAPVPLGRKIVLDWLLDSRIVTLNVAGPRESREPGLQAATRAALTTILADELGFGGR
ncbi:MAG TPA: putative molybdenum carrier protein [Gemmatimonadaceae bacterium]|nr:putative molybdenum carrier protein [Gemmatimonadaceae bacterium]